MFDDGADAMASACTRGKALRVLLACGGLRFEDGGGAPDVSVAANKNISSTRQAEAAWGSQRMAKLENTLSATTHVWPCPQNIADPEMLHELHLLGAVGSSLGQDGHQQRVCVLGSLHQAPPTNHSPRLK